MPGGATPNTTVSEVCTIVGTRLDPDSLAAVEGVRADKDLLARLSEPGAVAVDASEVGRLCRQLVTSFA